MRDNAPFSWERANDGRRVKVPHPERFHNYGVGKEMLGDRNLVARLLRKHNRPTSSLQQSFGARSKPSGAQPQLPTRTPNPASSPHSPMTSVSVEFAA